MQRLVRICEHIHPSPLRRNFTSSEGYSKYAHRWVDGREVGLPVGKVVCVARNYSTDPAEIAAARRGQRDEAMFFMKPGSAIISAGSPIRQYEETIFNEAELALLITKPLGRDASVEECADAIGGVAIALDLTLTNLQKTLKQKGFPWERAKAFDGSCPLSPFVPFDDALRRKTKNLEDVQVVLHVNNELRQNASTQSMLTLPLELLQTMGKYFGLRPGDVVLTGTPDGVKPLARGDHLVVELKDIVKAEYQVV